MPKNYSKMNHTVVRQTLTQFQSPREEILILHYISSKHRLLSLHPQIIISGIMIFSQPDRNSSESAKKRTSFRKRETFHKSSSRTDQPPLRNRQNGKFLGKVPKRTIQRNRQNFWNGIETRIETPLFELKPKTYLTPQLVAKRLPSISFSFSISVSISIPRLFSTQPSESRWREEPRFRNNTGPSKTCTEGYCIAAPIAKFCSPDSFVDPLAREPSNPKDFRSVAPSIPRRSRYAEFQFGSSRLATPSVRVPQSFFLFPEEADLQPRNFSDVRLRWICKSRYRCANTDPDGRKYLI